MGIIDKEPIRDDTKTQTRERFFRRKAAQDNFDIWLMSRGAVIDLGHWNDIKEAVKPHS